MDAAITWQSVLLFFVRFFSVVFCFSFLRIVVTLFERLLVIYTNRPSIDWMNICILFVSLPWRVPFQMNRMKNLTNVQCSGILLTTLSHCDFFLLILNTCSRLTEIRAQMSPENIRQNSISFVFRSIHSILCYLRFAFRLSIILLMIGEFRKLTTEIRNLPIK